MGFLGARHVPLRFSVRLESALSRGGQKRAPKGKTTEDQFREQWQALHVFNDPRFSRF
jgi:hypothetical protein